MIKVVHNGVDYTVTVDHHGMRGLHWKDGLSLAFHERGMIERAFFANTLGDSYQFPDDEQIWEFQPEGINGEGLEEQDQGGEEDRAPTSEEEAEEERRADFVHDRGREDYLAGNDSIYARYYGRSRGRG